MMIQRCLQVIQKTQRFLLKTPRYSISRMFLKRVNHIVFQMTETVQTAIYGYLTAVNLIVFQMTEVVLQGKTPHKKKNQSLVLSDVCIF